MELNYKVDVPLRTTDTYDIISRVDEVRTIIDWVDEQCEWDRNRYEAKILVTRAAIQFWFRDEHVALLTALRWL
jgi:hypothetical protein